MYNSCIIRFHHLFGNLKYNTRCTLDSLNFIHIWCYYFRKVLTSHSLPSWAINILGNFVTSLSTWLFFVRNPITNNYFDTKKQKRRTNNNRYVCIAFLVHTYKIVFRWVIVLIALLFLFIYSQQTRQWRVVKSCACSNKFFCCVSIFCAQYIRSTWSTCNIIPFAFYLSSNCTQSQCCIGTFAKNRMKNANQSN